MKPVIESLERRALLDGTLDPAYGNGGVVLTSFRNTNDAVAMAFQDDGKQVVVGSTQNAGQSKDVFVARYNVDGTLDTSFGVGGVVFLDLGAEDIATSVKLQDDGKVVAAGVTGDSTGLTGDAWVGRWTPDGKLDTTFFKKGYRVIDFGGADAVADVMLERPRTSDNDGAAALTSTNSGDDDIVLAGASLNLLGQTSGLVIAKVLASGVLDTRWGPGTGIFTTTPGKGFYDGLTSISRMGDRYLISGFQYQTVKSKLQFMLASIDCGCPYFDTNFGTNGRVFVDFGDNAAIAMDAKYDSYTNSVYAVGFTGDGLTGDLTPGLPNVGSLTGLATDARFAVTRLDTLGHFDTSFHGIGYNTFDFPGYRSAATGLVIQGDHKVVVGGGAQSASTGLSDFAFWRVGFNGETDTTFGNNGRLISDFGASDGAFRLFSRRNDPFGFYALGHSKFDTSFGRAAIARYSINSTAFDMRPPSFGVENIHRLVAPTTGTLSYDVRLMRAPTTPITVQYQSRNGTTLVGGTDYTPVSGTLTFNPGEMRKTIMVPYDVTQSGAASGSINVDLSSPSSGFLVNPTGTAWLNFLKPNLNQVRVTRVKPLKFPDQIVPGTGFQPLFSRVTLKNTGTKLLKGSELIKVYGSTDWRLDAGRDPLLGTFRTPQLSLKPGKTASFDVELRFPTGKRDTSYNMLASASGKGVSDASVNYARAADRFLVVTPAPTLVAGPGKRPAVKAPAGAKTTISFPITNTGNAPAVGLASFVINLTTDGTLGTVRYFFPPKKVPINIPAGGTVTVAIPITTKLLGGAGNMDKGKYKLLAVLTTTKLTFKNTTDNSTVATIPFTLT